MVLRPIGFDAHQFLAEVAGERREEIFAKRESFDDCVALLFKRYNCFVEDYALPL